MNEFVQVNPTTACSSSDNQDLSSVSIDFQTRPLAPIGIPENSYYKRWCFSDKLFEGKFKSGNETPSTPHTPAINTEKRLRSIEMSTVKQSFKKRDIGNFEARFIMNKENPGFNTQETPLKMPKMIQEAETSRYDQDYIQESLLGSGNFGSVYKCINKIDGLQYAVKQIKTSARNKILKQEALQEAYTLATSSTCEDNTYVIRYHSV